MGPDHVTKKTYHTVLMFVIITVFAMLTVLLSIGNIGDSLLIAG